MARQPIHAIAYPLQLGGTSRKLAEENDYGSYVEQLVRQVLLTGPGERINRPDFGAGVRRLVFEPNGNGTAGLAKAMIYQALTKWLGALIRVESIEVRSQDATLLIDIVYMLLQRGQRRYLNVEVTL